MGCYPPQPVSVLGLAPTLSPSFLLAQAIFEQNLFLYEYPNILKPRILHTYPPTKMEQSVSKRRHRKIQTPENYPEEYNIYLNTACLATCFVPDDDVIYRRVQKCTVSYMCRLHSPTVY